MIWRSIVLGAFLLCYGLTALEARPPSNNSTWRVSYSSGFSDVNGHFVGGTQIRSAVTHYICNGCTIPVTGATCSPASVTWVSAKSGCAVVFAGNGYWFDQWGPEGPQHPQVLALATPLGAWGQDVSLTGGILACGSCFAVVEEMGDHTFTTNATGPITPVEVAMASTQNASNAKVYLRDDTTGTWSNNTVTACTGTCQARGMGSHLDTSNSIDTWFVGIDDPTNAGIFRGTFGNSHPYSLTFGASPEPFCPLANISGNTCSSTCTGALSGCTNLPADWGETCPGGADCQSSCNTKIIPCNMQLRVMAIGACQDSSGIEHAFAFIGEQVFERNDVGAFWFLFAKVPVSSIGTDSQSGLRGLYCIGNPSGAGGQLLATTEGKVPVFWHINTTSGAITNEINLETKYNSICGGGTTSYRIDAYNNMIAVNNSLVFGQGVGDGVSTTPSCPSVNWNSGTSLFATFTQQWAGLWLRSNNSSPIFSLIRVPPMMPQYMLSTYTVVSSPFPNDSSCIYAGGFDNSSTPAHNTGWIMRGCGLNIP